MSVLGSRQWPWLLAMSGMALSVPTSANETQGVDHSDLEGVTATFQQAYRGNVPAYERPQAMDELERDTISTAGLTDFQDVLNMSATVSRQNNLGGMWDSFSLRGFPGNENMPSGYLLNGFSGGRGYSGRRDVSNIERVEVIKGPGSALYGRSEPGGTINVVTLKPEYFTEGSITAETGSYNHKRVQADVTGELSSRVAGRLNGAWEDSDSFRDHVYQKRQTLTPSLLFDIDERSSLLYEMEYVKQQQPLDRGVVVLNNHFNTVPDDRFLGEPNDGPITTKAWGHQLGYQYDLENGWNFNAGVTQRQSSLQGYSTETELSSRQTLSETNSSLVRQRRYRDYHAVDRSVRAELSGKAELAGMTHNLMLGADSYRYFLDEFMLRYRRDKNDPTDSGYAIDIHNPVYGQDKPQMGVNTDRLEYQQAFGVYLQDQVELNDRWQVLLGARFDQYSQRLTDRKSGSVQYSDGDRISPRMGVTMQLTPDWLLYTSYSEGFIPLNGADASGNQFDPEESKSTEIGAKFQVNSWTGSIAVFDAYKSNILTADTVNATSIQLGEIRSTGVELDAQGYVADRLSMTFSYAWLDTRTTRAFEDNDWWATIKEGSPILNVPEHTVSLSAKQAFDLAGREAYVSANYQYIDERLGDTVNQDYRLPSYSLVNLSAGSDIGSGFSGKLVINNLFDESYIPNSYNALWTQPGEPRTVKANVTYAF